MMAQPEKLPETDERRKHDRKTCFLDVDFEIQQTSDKYVVENISVEGAFVATRETFQEGDLAVLRLWFLDEEQPLKLDSRVVHIAPDGIGVRFENLTPELSDRIVTLLKSLPPG